jgi:hypothetical protein
MGWAYRKYGGRGKVHTELWLENLRKTDNLEDIRVDRNDIL